MNHRHVLIGAMVLAAVPAQARFGHAGSAGHSSSSSSSHSSSSVGAHASPSSSSHGSAPVGSAPSSSGTGTSTVGRPGGYGYDRGYGSLGYGYGYGYNPYRYGYYSGAFVPMYGYGYGYWVGPSQSAASPVVREESSLRVTAGVEAMTYVLGDPGLTLGLSGHVEGERWGFYLAGQNIAVHNAETSSFDTIQQVSARITFAFLTGRYGRLRAELGGDSVFTRDLVALGPTGGLSGTLWIGGPVALEGSVMVTPVPFWQLDYKVGVAVGVGPVGLRAGWRTQVLDDRGVVDGVAHKDSYMGPYVGVAMVF